MRAFIILCLVAVACADKLGYNYQPVGHSDSGLSFAPGADNVGVSYDAPTTLYSAPAAVAAPTTLYAAPAPVAAPTTLYAAPAPVATPTTVYSAPAPVAELEKEFYTFSAPEGEFDDVNGLQRAIGSVKQGLRVVFIKGPENKGLEDAALALARQAAQQQTAIYVLNKQADIGGLVDKINAANKNANGKPEVHFVKYRTAADAANAQSAIQSQYDQLGGNSQSFNGGVAPVLNFASQAAVRAVHAQSPQAAYLPSSVFRHRL